MYTEIVVVTRLMIIIKIKIRILIEVEEILCSWASDCPMLRATIFGEDKPGLASKEALISHKIRASNVVPLSPKVAKRLSLLSSSVRHSW